MKFKISFNIELILQLIFFAFQKKVKSNIEGISLSLNFLLKTNPKTALDILPHHFFSYFCMYISSYKQLVIL